jgi:hypothetical protein
VEGAKKRSETRQKLLLNVSWRQSRFIVYKIWRLFLQPLQKSIMLTAKAGYGLSALVYLAPLQFILDCEHVVIDIRKCMAGRTIAAPSSTGSRDGRISCSDAITFF